MGNLEHLKELQVRRNRLAALPESLSRYSQLEELHLDHNHISKLSFVSATLRVLTISYNSLTALPAWIVQCQELRQLDMAHNRLETVDSCIEQCRKLDSLDLSMNYITQLPDTVVECPVPQTLNLATNMLAGLPSGMGDLQNLRQLDLKHNNLETLPESFKKLDLIKLDISYNIFAKFPEQTMLRRRLALYSMGNRWQSMPNWVETRPYKESDSSEESDGSL